MKKTRSTWVWAIVALALLVAAGVVNLRLTSRREAYHLIQAEAPENMPPLVTFSTVALGGFRGVVVDLLWVRAAQLQTQGKYFELVQLTDWITKLEPRSAQIWAYHAWNLAYNISVMMPEPADRWRWIRHGIELLRDEGLIYNPASPQLHRELAWIFFHKIGGDMDRFHKYYKARWAADVQEVLGGPRPDWPRWRRLPADRPALMKDPETAELVAALRQGGFAPFELSWTHVEAAREIRSKYDTGMLKAYVRRQQLRDVLGLDPDVMLEMERQYGAIDWRLTDAQVLYWCHTGLPTDDAFEASSMERYQFYALNRMLTGGRLAAASGSIYYTVPCLDYLPVIYEAVKARTGMQLEIDRTQRRNFLVDALTLTRAYGRTNEWQRWADELARLTGEPLDAEALEPILAQRRLSAIQKNEAGFASALIHGALYRAANARGAGRMAAADELRAEARRLYEVYHRGLQNPLVMQRLGLAPFDLMQQSAAMEPGMDFTSETLPKR